MMFRTRKHLIWMWWALAPDAQFIQHPGGNIAPPGHGPSAPLHPIPNATVLGVRSSIVF